MSRRIKTATGAPAVPFSGRREVIAVGVLFLALLPFYSAVYVGMMPNAQGGVGHDYSQFLPNLLEGYYWYLNNGLAAIPWFTPAQCGGMPYYPDPEVMYYSVPQFLTFVIPPFAAVKVTFWLFAAAGFWGCWALARFSFRISAAAAALAAALFMFNGFFAYRMLIGHLTFHAFMLAPAAAAALLPPPDAPGVSRAGTVLRIGTAALCFAYMFHSGLVLVLPPVIIACVVLMLMHALAFGWRRFPWLAFGVAGALSLALVAGKLAASLAFLHYFPRDEYVLPGIANLGKEFALVFQTLFLSVPADATKAITNMSTPIGRYEWEYGVSPVPAVFIAAWLVAAAADFWRRRAWPKPTRLGAVTAGLILLLLLIPIALNWYWPPWNSLLKTAPYFRSNSKLVRWFSEYVPVAVMLGALAFDRLRLTLPRHAPLILAGLGIAGMLGWNLHLDRSYYLQDEYKVATIDDAYAAAAATHTVPPITGITAFLTPGTDRVRILTLEQNDPMTKGQSQLACYQPLFGYALERFPVKSLRPGPVTRVTNGVFNVKNPACYVYPAANHCEPGDHFAAADAERMQEFVHYEPFPFAEPDYEKWLNALSLVAIVAVVGAMVWAGIETSRAAFTMSRPLPPTPAPEPPTANDNPRPGRKRRPSRSGNNRA